MDMIQGSELPVNRQCSQWREVNRPATAGLISSLNADASQGTRVSGCGGSFKANDVRVIFVTPVLICRAEADSFTVPWCLRLRPF